MERILETLCEQWHKTSPHFYERQEVKEQYEKLADIERKLNQHFNEEEMILIRKAMDEQSNYDSMQAFDYFVQGIRCGVQLYDELKEVDVNQLYGLKYG